MPEHFDRNGRDAGLRPYQARQRCQAFARRPKLPGLACALASLAALGACGSEPEPQPPESRPARLYTLDATDDLRTFRFPPSSRRHARPGSPFPTRVAGWSV